MLNLAEYRHKPQSLADFLPWAALVADGVVLNKDGSLQRTARFRGPDLDSATPAELVGVTARLNNALRRLGSGWVIFVEASRHCAQDYPVSQFPDPVSSLLDAERAAQFEEEGAHFESAYYLTFVFLPPAEEAARAESFLYEGRVDGGRVDAHQILKGFIDRTDRVLQLIEGFVPEAAWLSDAETLTYLHSCISTRRHRVRVPEVPMYLDAILVDESLVGGLAPRLGKAHLRTLTVMGFPSVTYPGILDDLNRLALPYRWSTRAVALDKTDATRVLTRIRRQWFAKRKSVAAILKEVMTNEASALLDTDAHNKALDADAALQELGSDLIGQAYVTATVTVWDDDARVAEERLRLVEKVIQGRDFTCIAETVNAVEAWLGSLPGHVYANVRQPPVSTLNLAHMMPLSAVWAGPERNEHLDGPPLLFAKTEGATPFRLSLHVGDVGHTLVVGPTGAGKSVLLALLALQFRRYPGARLFAFDFGGSIRAAALGMAGDWHDLGGALSNDAMEPVALQPLAAIDDAGERAWAAQWVAAILAREGVKVTPEAKEHLWSALGSLASAPIPERTLTGLSVLLQSSALKQALQPYCVGGPWGRLLDAEAEHLGETSVQAFETEGLIGTGAAPAVLARWHCPPTARIGRGMQANLMPLRRRWRAVLNVPVRPASSMQLTTTWCGRRIDTDLTLIRGEWRCRSIYSRAVAVGTTPSHLVEVPAQARAVSGNGIVVLPSFVTFITLACVASESIGRGYSRPAERSRLHEDRKPPARDKASLVPRGSPPAEQHRQPSAARRSSHRL
jgi:type IV secretion/conjugal transfer VirB4 family ATPase